MSEQLAKNIIVKGLSKGILFTPEALEFLKLKPEADIEKLLTQNWRSKIITKRELILAERPVIEIKVLRNLSNKPQPSTELQMKFFTSRYDKMKKIVSERMPDRTFYSLGRLPSRAQEIYIMGIVKAIRSDEKFAVELEDPIGSKTVIFDKEPECSVDEAVTIKASIANNIVFGKQVLFPDIPLRQPTKGKGRACFVSDLHMDEAPMTDLQKFFSWLETQDNIDWLFVLGDTGNTTMFEEFVWDKPTLVIPGHADKNEDYPQTPLKFSKNNIVSLSNPAIVAAGGVNLLLIHEFRLEMLKKRHLGASSTILEEDFLTLDVVPDIIAYGHDHKPFITNYKSTTIVNSGSPLTELKPVIVDMETRDVKQVTL